MEISASEAVVLRENIRKRSSGRKGREFRVNKENVCGGSEAKLE